MGRVHRFAGSNHPAADFDSGGQRQSVCHRFHTHGMKRLLPVHGKLLADHRLARLFRIGNDRGGGKGLIIAVAKIRLVRHIRVKRSGFGNRSVRIGQPEIAAHAPGGSPAVTDLPGPFCPRAQAAVKVSRSVLVVPAHQQHVMIGDAVGAVKRGRRSIIAHPAVPDRIDPAYRVVRQPDADLHRAVDHDLLFDLVPVRNVQVIRTGNLRRNGSIGGRQAVRVIVARIGVVRFRSGTDQPGQDMPGQVAVAAVVQVAFLSLINHAVSVPAGLGIRIVVGGIIGKEEFRKVNGGTRSGPDQVRFHAADRGEGPAGVEISLVPDRGKLVILITDRYQPTLRDRILRTGCFRFFGRKDVRGKDGSVRKGTKGNRGFLQGEGSFFCFGRYDIGRSRLLL